MGQSKSGDSPNQTQIENVAQPVSGDKGRKCDKEIADFGETQSFFDFFVDQMLIVRLCLTKPVITICAVFFPLAKFMS